MFVSSSKQSHTVGGEKNRLVIQVNVCYIRLNTPRFSTHSLKIRMTSNSCNKYEQIRLSHLLVLTSRCLPKRYAEIPQFKEAEK